MPIDRDFCYSLTADQTINSYAAEDPTIHDIIEGFEWNLVRNPEKGMQLDGVYWLYRTEKISPIRPTISVLYMFNDQRISIIAVWINSPDPE